MDINLTLIGQIITFLVFVWFTMNYVWPPLRKAMEERKQKIAEGLAAGDQARKDLELAEHKAMALLREAKLEASHVVEQANKRANHILEEAKETARVEAQRLIEHAHGEIDQQMNQVKRELRAQVAAISLSAAEKIVRRDIDPRDHQEVLDHLLSEI